MISTGKSAASPHCSSLGVCEYNDATKKACANALCIAQGYPIGTFVEASNNFCTSSYTPDNVYVYRLDVKDIVFVDHLTNANREAKITADCAWRGDV